MAERPIANLFTTVVDDVTAVGSDIAALAKHEFKADAKRTGKGSVAFVAALCLLPLILVTLVFACAEGMVALGLPRWAAFLIDALIIIVAAVLLAWWGWRRFKRLTGPRQTMAAIRGLLKALAGQAPESQPSAASPVTRNDSVDVGGPESQPSTPSPVTDNLPNNLNSPT
ncbi:MAG: phage holin family protein [Bifidobacteriaceae bacterium]|jgi:hypothetical protein|nr:phage holin family protein [Bifidobacteriaceae bacterium]